MHTLGFCETCCTICCLNSILLLDVSLFGEVFPGDVLTGDTLSGETLSGEVLPGETLSGEMVLLEIADDLLLMLVAVLLACSGVILVAASQ